MSEQYETRAATQGGGCEATQGGGMFATHATQGGGAP